MVSIPTPPAMPATVGGVVSASVARAAGGSSPAPTPIYPQFPLGTKISAEGDSTLAHGTYGVSPGTRLVRKINAGPWEVAQAMVPRFSFEQWASDTTARDNAAAGGASTFTKQWTDGANRAVSGSNRAFHASLLASTLAMGAPLVVCPPTVNSVADPNAEQLYVDTIVTPILTARDFVIIPTMLPWSPSGQGFDTPANVASRLRINAFCRNLAATYGPSKAILFDFDIALGVGQDGYAAADNFYDTLHPNSVGAARLAAYINSRLDLLMPRGNTLLARTGPNRQPNWNFTGTGGTAAGTVSGPIPTGYRLINASGTSATAVVTLEPNPDTGGQTVVVAIQPVAGSAAEEGFNFTFGTAGQIPISDLADKSVGSFFEVGAPASPYAGMPTVTLYDPGTTEEARALDVDSNYGNSSKSDGVARTWWPATDAVKIGAASAGPNVTLRLRFRGAEAFAAGAAPIVFRIKRSDTGDIGPPKPRWNS